MGSGVGVLRTILGVGAQALGLVSTVDQVTSDVFEILAKSSGYTNLWKDIVKNLQKSGFSKDEFEIIFQQARAQKHSLSYTSGQTQVWKIFLQLSVDVFAGIYGPVSKDKHQQKKMADFTFGFQSSELRRNMTQSFKQGIKLQQLDEHFSSNYFLSVVPKLIQHFLYEGLFTEILKYRDFFDVHLVETIEQAKKIYDGLEDTGNISLELIGRGLHIVSLILFMYPHPVLKAIEKYLYIFFQIQSFLQKKASYYLAKGSNEIIFSENEILHLNGLVSVGYTSLKSIALEEYTKIGFYIGNMAIFGRDIPFQQADTFYKHPFLDKVIKSDFSKEKKTLLCKILLYIDDTQENLFSQVMSYDEGKLIDIEKFLRSKNSQNIDAKNYYLVFQYNLEGNLGIFQVKFKKYLDIIFVSSRIIDCLGNLSEELLMLAYELQIDDEEELYFLLLSNENISQVRVNIAQRDFCVASLAYTGMSENEVSGYSATIGNINIFQSSNDFGVALRLIMGEQGYEGTLDQTIQKNKQRFFRRSGDLIRLLPSIYVSLQNCSQTYISRIMWEIFDTHNTDDQVYIIAQIVIHFGNPLEIYKLHGKLKEFVNAFFEEGFTMQDISSENIQIVFQLWGIVQPRGSERASESGKEKKQNIFELYPENIPQDIKDDFISHFQDVSDAQHLLIIETLGLLNGYQTIFLSWLIKNNQDIGESILDNIFRVFYFFASLGKNAIRNFDNIEKIFDFVLPLESMECHRRISVLYEIFGTPDRQVMGGYEEFKKIIIRYLKNGDESIIDDYLYPDEHEEVVEQQKKRAGGGRLLPISEKDFIRRIVKLGYMYVRGSGGHLQFKSQDGTKHITIPHSSHRDTVDKGNIKQIVLTLGLTISEWNNL